MIKHAVKASSFADPRDIEAFKKAKAKGMSDEQAFKYGDNGIGCWGNDTTEGSGPSCALPPDDMVDRYGTINGAKHKGVVINTDDKQVVAVLKDRMPWKKNIKTAARIDLNPDTCAALNLKPPVFASVVWHWEDAVIDERKPT
jgi:hypothetical protein